MEALKKNKLYSQNGPVVFIIMDGIGLSAFQNGNALFHARTPSLDTLMKLYPHVSLRAHGTAVGLPGDGDMGNSEVGHNALGAGRIFDQGAKLVNKSLKSGSLFRNTTWQKCIENIKKHNSTLHFIGLLSDGNVHSHIDQLFEIIRAAADSGIARIRIHVLLDGRDVHETSALIYIDQLESFLAGLNTDNRDYRIASGGGRMVTTMDRYESDWGVVKNGWDAHVLGASRPFRSATEAIETYRNENNGIKDQYLPSFTLVDENGPVGPIIDNDSVILFNFRGDRAIEISRAFEEPDFTCFDRERYPSVYYAGMMEYDGDLKIPSRFLVQSPILDRTISEYLVRSGCRQYAVSETQKFGHVTYFWNGNRSGKFDESLETYEEIPSDRLQFDERPWMKAAEITDCAIKAITGGQYDFIRLNYPNGDMVGHTGNFEAAVIAAETVDLCLNRLLRTVEEHKACAIITADHGNLEEMYQLDKSGNIVMNQETGEPVRKTAHTLNPVPFIIFNPGDRGSYRFKDFDNPPGLANVASTLLFFLGYEAPDDYLPSLVVPVK